MAPSSEHFMRVAIEEAKKGLGRTSPNPCVGAVIVRDGRIISKGYHKKAGEPHAEIEALNSSLDDVVGATMFVTLEPCSHTGRTGPCCESIVKAGLQKVVIGMTDPNPVVNGRGIRYLEEHGIIVESGVLEKQCIEINYPFVKFIQTGLPWVIMKAGMSLDGRLCYQSGESGWMTGEESSRVVHGLRDTVDAILVGINTIRVDNPSLTTRLEGKECKDPIRIILDSRLETPVNSKILHLKSKAPTWFICSQAASEENKTELEKQGAYVVEVESDNRGIKLDSLLQFLGSKGLCSVLVEGGGAIHGGFLQARLYDYAYLFYGSLFAGDQGVSLATNLNISNREQAIKLANLKVQQLGEDVLIEGKVNYPPR